MNIFQISLPFSSSAIARFPVSHVTFKGLCSTAGRQMRQEADMWKVKKLFFFFNINRFLEFTNANPCAMLSSLASCRSRAITIVLASATSGRCPSGVSQFVRDSRVGCSERPEPVRPVAGRQKTILALSPTVMV